MNVKWLLFHPHWLTRFSATAFALSFGALGWAQQPDPTVAGAAVVARLADMQVRQDEVEQFMRALPPADRVAVRQNGAAVELMLRQRLANEALLKEARQQQWAERPEIRAKLQAAVQEVTDRVISSSYLDSVTQLPAGFPSDAELNAAYARAKSQLQIAATYHVAQIYLPVEQGTNSASVQAEAAKLSKQARQGDFAALAKARSQDAPSAAQGGDVGNLPLAQMRPEFRETVAAMKPGEVSDPVQSPSGFHVLKLLAHQAARAATFEEAKPGLQTLMREQRRRELAYNYLNKLAPASGVSFDHAALDAALRNVR